MLGAFVAASCSQAQADEAAQPSSPAPDAAADDAAVNEARALATREAIADAEAIAARLRETGSPAGEACRVACATSYALLCHRVTTLCAAATVVSVGGSTVPCATAVLAACPGGVALATLCAGQCPP